MSYMNKASSPCHHSTLDHQRFYFTILSHLSYEVLLCEISPPRIADIIQVHKRDVVVTQGIRAHIGMKAKLRNMDGIQIFQSAIKSSLMFFLYAVIARFISGMSAFTTISLVA